MFEQQPETAPNKVKSLVEQSLRQSDPTGWFEVLYSEANGDYSQVPWARLKTNPYLLDWLNLRQPQGNGKRALVIGCGLGDDAEALAQQGFKVTAFDISTTAIAWCQQRFPNSSVTYLVTDLFALDPSWHQAFDLVFETYTIQALPLSVRPKVIQLIAPLVAPEGTLLVITLFRHTDAEPDGPPWPLSDKELNYFQELGLLETYRDSFVKDDNKAITALRIEYSWGK
ncbi:MAG: class I SAM-dependent methyltransferase [Symploca sp. SIO3C6]|nr:class I SAM-dependent methyltransferase [Symploca sp. SIO3C6]NET08163.1 class I SAM-dependent methyltransferase [Symploca sp. SIO2B6]